MHCHVGGVGFSRLTALFFGSVDAEILTGEPRIGFDGFGDVVLDAFHGSPVLAIAVMVVAGDAEEILGDVHPTVRTGVELDFKAEHFRLLIVANGFQLCLMVSAYHGRGVFSIFRRVAVMVRHAAGMGLDCQQSSREGIADIAGMDGCHHPHACRAWFVRLMIRGGSSHVEWNQVSFI